jgi:hypothetical protein
VSSILLIVLGVCKDHIVYIEENYYYLLMASIYTNVACVGLFYTGPRKVKDMNIYIAQIIAKLANLLVKGEKNQRCFNVIFS